MKNAIILHGKPVKEEFLSPDTPSSSNYHWIPWLQKQLILSGVKADTPEAPQPYDPQWDLWVREVERFEIGPQTLLVGHSCGGGFWVRYLSEHKDLQAGKVVLVAPSLGLGWKDNDFFKFEIDPDLTSRVKEIVIIYSDDDKQSTLDAVEIIKDKLKNVKIQKLHGRGHFAHRDMPSAEFPELLEECLVGN